MRIFFCLLIVLSSTGCANAYSSRHKELSQLASIENASWDKAYEIIEERCYHRKLPSLKLYECTQHVFDQTVSPAYPDLYKRWASTQKRIFVDRSAGKITADQATAYMKDLSNQYFSAADQRAGAELQGAAIKDYYQASALSSALSGMAAASPDAWSHPQPSAAILSAPRSIDINCYNLNRSVHCTSR
jgi:hypothetical protein